MDRSGVLKSKAAEVILDLYEKPMYFSELTKEKGYSALTLQKILDNLLDKQLVEIKQEKLAQKGYPRDVYSLMDKGKKIAEKLADINWILSHNEEINEQALNELYQTVLEHVNVIDNVVRVKDGKRIADVYVRELHGKIKLHCDLCDSDSCIHVNFAYTLPEVRKLIEEHNRL